MVAKEGTEEEATMGTMFCMQFTLFIPKSSRFLPKLRQLRNVPVTQPGELLPHSPGTPKLGFNRLPTFLLFLSSNGLNRKHHIKELMKGILRSCDGPFIYTSLKSRHGANIFYLCSFQSSLHPT
ncbi:unnamed protein product [Caretta caretta]